MFDSEKIKEYTVKARSKVSIPTGKDRTFAIIVIALIVFTSIWIFVTSPSESFDDTFLFEVEKGASLKGISQSLKDEGLIRSRTVFNTIVILSRGDGQVISGEYLFHSPPTVFEVADRLTKGDYGIESKRVTIPEGSTVKQIGLIFDEGGFINFDIDAFYQLAKGKEGYLFPDTYLFLENVRAHEVVELLESTFNEKIKEIKNETDTNIPLEDIVIMASIIEREATEESRQEVSDILWKRLEIGMALQVDATFVYSHGKGTFDLTLADLRDQDNPYNTYVFKGLPPTAIANPGYESLKAAADPGDTPYLFFLTGRDGEMYYAETFAGHKQNRARYLD